MQAMLETSLSGTANKNNGLMVAAIPAFTDNYIWCIHNNEHAVVVDPGDAQPVMAYLQSKGLTLSAILVTHHHYDHTGGIQDLINQYKEIAVYGPHNPKIKEINLPLKEQDKITLAHLDISFSILETPGHTLDHIAFYNKDALFCGDTLFSAGCGRMFEGTPEVFYSSLQKLTALPANTPVYCTHEYTQANVSFALSVEPNNQTLTDYQAWVKTKREAAEITLPSTIEKESAINPFLRCHIDDIQANVLKDKKASASTQARLIETFAAVRSLKDNF